MSNFTSEQLQALGKKLHRRYVHTREVGGRSINYIEGWFAIAEANAIFGYAGWDRETTHLERLYERSRGETTSCGYFARVRIRVRAGDTLIVREGTGLGHAIATTPSDAHERAVKTAETDAMKRAFATFGNRFGLCLYDKGKNGVTGKKPVNAGTKPETSSKKFTSAGAFILHAPDSTRLAECLSPEGFCSGLRQLIDSCKSTQHVTRLHDGNRAHIARLREESPRLTNGNGVHYADLLEQLIARRLADFGDTSLANGKAAPELMPASVAPSKIASGPRIDKSVLAIATERRVRDKAHLRYVASQPCVVCDRKDTQAHHVRFAQKRGLSQKVSDEYTVPLCVAHHAELHRNRNEQHWWRNHSVNPFPVAAELWEESRRRKERHIHAVSMEEAKGVPPPIASANLMPKSGAPIA